MRKKIFFLLFSMNVGGVEKSLLGLLGTLSKDEFDVHVGLLQKKGGFLEQLPDNVTVHECCCGCWEELNLPPRQLIEGYVRKCRFFRALLICYAIVLRKIFKRSDLYFRMLLHDDPVSKIHFDEAYAYAGPASIIDYYVCEKIHAEKKYGWIHYDVSKFGIDSSLIRLFYHKYEKVYVVSETAKERFDELFPEVANKTEVRYNVVSREQIKTLATFGESFNDCFSGKRILTVGRLSSEKGQDVCIDSLKFLLDRGMNVKWYFVGDGKLRDLCRKKACALGVLENVVFLGLKSNPYAYMRDCDVYVQPSRHEGFCITLAEAKVFGKPIVSTDFTGAREQLKSYSKGSVVGMNADEIAKGILDFI